MIAGDEQAGALQGNLQAAAHELVRRHTLRGGDTQEDIAQAVGMALGRFSQVLNTPGTPLPVHLAVRLHRLLKDDYLTQAICHACDGFFVALPAEASAAERALGAFETAMNRLSSVMQESGEAMSVATKVIRDRIATREEKALVKREILETISALGLLLQGIDAMPERAAAPGGRAGNLREAG